MARPGRRPSKPGFDATAWWARTGLDGPGARRRGGQLRRARCPAWATTPRRWRTYGADRHRALSAREDRQGQLRRLVAAGERAVGQCLLGAGGAVRRQGAAAAAARARRCHALRVHYQCRDGRWLLLSIAADEWRWEKFKTCFDARGARGRRVSRPMPGATGMPASWWRSSTSCSPSMTSLTGARRSTMPG